MWVRFFAAIVFLSASWTTAHADIPQPGRFPWSRPQPRVDHRFDFTPVETKSPVRLAISTDSAATTARLIVPAKLLASLQTPEQPRIASTINVPVVALISLASLVAAGLWFTRHTGGKYALAAALLAVTLLGVAVHAQSSSPGTILETGK